MSVAILVEIAGAVAVVAVVLLPFFMHMLIAVSFFPATTGAHRSAVDERRVGTLARAEILDIIIANARAVSGFAGHIDEGSDLCEDAGISNSDGEELFARVERACGFRFPEGVRASAFFFRKRALQPAFWMQVPPRLPLTAGSLAGAVCRGDFTELIASKMSRDEIVASIVATARAVSGYSEKIDEASELYRDIGIFGDDADDFFVELEGACGFAVPEGVDLGVFFPDDDGFFFTRLPADSRSLRPLTVGTSPTLSTVATSPRSERETFDSIGPLTVSIEWRPSRSCDLRRS